MSKRLLVLAAARYQLDTILCAKRLGHAVVTLDNCPGNPGHRQADRSYDIDTTDREAVLEVARKERIDGVIAACTDVAVPTAAFVAGKMSLPGPPVESAEIACSKLRFRDFLTRHGFEVPQSIRIDSRFEPEAEIFDGNAWIMKPDMSSGSKGIFVVESRAEFLERWPETASFSPGGSGILEQFIDGRQGTCEGILRHGEIALSCIMDRLTADRPYVATRGHVLPASLPAPAQEMLLSNLNKVWNLLGVTDGPFDCDFVAAKDGVYLIEISPRMGGNCIANLMREALSFDIVEHSVRVALGEDPQLPPDIRLRPAATVILGVPQAGRLMYDRKEVEALRKEPWLRSLELDVEYGAAVQPFTNGRHRLGEAILSGRDREEVEARIAELNRRLNLHALGTHETSASSAPQR